MELSIGNTNLGNVFESLTTKGVDDADRAARAGENDEAAEGFERLFSRMLVREMRRGLKDGPFGKGPGADVYEAWFDEHLAESLVERNTLGFAEMVRASLLRDGAGSAVPGAAEAPGTNDIDAATGKVTEHAENQGNDRGSTR